MFIVMAIHEKMLTTSGVIEMTWADGMTGCVPVFATKEDAEKYAGGSIRLWKLRCYNEVAWFGGFQFVGMFR